MINLQKRDLKKNVLAVLIIILIINLPLITALQISDVRVENITSAGAIVTWKTDQPEDSTVFYGKDKSNLQPVIVNALVTNHQVPITGLASETAYQYSVKSDGVTDDNSGNLYPFKTLAAPAQIKINATLPVLLKGKVLDITGDTEPAAVVSLLVNAKLVRSGVADGAGRFQFANIVLLENQANAIVISATNTAGGKASISGTITTDNSRPQITLKQLPSFIDKDSIEIEGTISEAANFEIFVDDKSQAKGEGTNIKQIVRLKEGRNVITVMVHDAAGWEHKAEAEIISDTKPVSVTAELSRGKEYYEGRASSDINGKTKAGAKVFLYVYRPLGYEYKPDFKKARAVVTADQNGTFTFKDVEFSASIFDKPLEDFAPREVPSGLQQFSIFPTSYEAQQQTFPYYLFIVAEDITGKTASWQQTINVHTCFSQNLDFSVESLPKFQAPLRLVPQLLDEGRQEVQAVFQLNYLGKGLPKIVNGQEFEKGVKVTRITFEKACTAGMVKDDKFNLGCKIFPEREKLQLKNGDGSSVYVTWNLHASSELSKQQGSFWDDFKKRQIVFPLKMRIEYQDRLGDNKYGETKFQTVCTDLGYFVDIPIESKNLLPDFLANEGVQSLDWTVRQLQTIRPYIEKAYLVTGIGCMGSFLFRTVVRWWRIFESNTEYYYSAAKKAAGGSSNGDGSSNKEGDCPSPAKQNKDLFLQETLDSWKELRDNYGADIPSESTFPDWLGTDKELEHSLDKRCKSTASAWKFEANIDKLYKWTCDRAFCRKVPAGWTADKEIPEIQDVILKEQQCAVTGRGVSLQKIENCKELLKQNVVHVNAPLIQQIKEENAPCWRDAKTTYYYDQKMHSQNAGWYEDTKKGIYHLTPVTSIIGDLQIPQEPLIAFKPEGSDTFIVGRDDTCTAVCNNPRKPGYRADKGGVYGPLLPGEVYGPGDENGCYAEKADENGNIKLYDVGGTVLGKQAEAVVNGKPVSSVPERYSAGYTRDCFVDTNSGVPQFKQCVCVGKSLPKVAPTVRTALKKNGNTEEKWFYQQERVFEESKKTAGTYYPEIRYYDDRDFSGAFGANNLLDYVRLGSSPEIATVDPHSQITGALQSVCLSSILKNMKMLESILVGLRNCLEQAKRTKIQDAGACKTIFTQHVCGLLYKGIAYFTNQCHPLNFDDVNKEGSFGDIGALFSNGVSSMNQALESSVQDLKDDYGNAQLNQYFKGGAQGFTQSICLAAFGYEFPMFSDEFLLDAAYATPTKTTVLMVPKERELSTYNPALQTAVFNYNIGGLIFPGCRIRSWQVSLKCIGPEDFGRPGMDPSCNGKGCDCLNAQGLASPLEGEKTKVLMRSFGGIPSGQMFSIPLPSPQRVDSHYRYDHVVVELTLDPTEKGNEDKCFDKGYFVNGKGMFYEPLIDITPRVELSCHADLVSGRYVCPELSTLFGFGGAYFQEPYITCKNKQTDSWTDCATPNLFVRNDPIKVRAYLNLDDKGKCLKRTVYGVPGIQETVPLSLPENIPGPLFREDNLGLVSDQMFGAVSNTIQPLPGDSNSKCPRSVTPTSTPTEVLSSSQIYAFQFVPIGEKVQLIVPLGVTAAAPFFIEANQGLSQGGIKEFTVAEINRIEFNVGGFKIKNVLGDVSPSDNINKCSYQIVGRSAVAGLANYRDIQVAYELFERDEGGGCTFARQQVKSSSPIQPTKVTQSIRIQREAGALAQVGGLHNSFMNGNYEQVQNLALQTINQKKGDLENALAIYYYAASFISKSTQGGIKSVQTELVNLLDLFFKRQWNGESVLPYDDQTKSTLEYQKINAYMCEIAKTTVADDQGRTVAIYTSPAGCQT